MCVYRQRDNTPTLSLQAGKEGQMAVGLERLYEHVLDRSRAIARQGLACE